MKIIYVLFLAILFFALTAVSFASDVNSTDVDNLNAQISSFKNQTLPYENLNSTQKMSENQMSDLSSQKPSKLIAKNIKSSYGKKVIFKVKLLDQFGKGIEGMNIIFKTVKKTYKLKTDSHGIAHLQLNYPSGKYTIHYKIGDLKGSNTYSVKNSYSITVFKWKSGANILKNSKIKQNIPKSNLVKKLIKYAKKGTPLIKSSGGKGKKVFITSGVHGNELSSQIASLRLVKYLQNHPIKGTVYIMPFINPKGTANNVRDWAGIHLNKKANVKGTISFKTVKLIKRFKCDVYGDFHCTRPGGKPGKNVAMGTYSPSFKSASMAKFISKDSKVNCIIYKKAGTEYPGALEDVVSLNHIPAVTCEVITPHGHIAKGTVSKSLNMMKSLLKFNKVI